MQIQQNINLSINEESTFYQRRGERGTEMDMDWVYYGFVEEIAWSWEPLFVRCKSLPSHYYFIGFVRKAITVCGWRRKERIIGDGYRAMRRM